jgi:hypothetical protein
MNALVLQPTGLAVANLRTVVADFLHHVIAGTPRQARLSPMTNMLRYFTYLLVAAPSIA